MCVCVYVFSIRQTGVEKTSYYPLRSHFLFISEREPRKPSLRLISNFNQQEVPESCQTITANKSNDRLLNPCGKWNIKQQKEKKTYHHIIPFFFFHLIVQIPDAQTLLTKGFDSLRQQEFISSRASLWVCKELVGEWVNIPKVGLTQIHPESMKPLPTPRREHTRDNTFSPLHTGR